MTRRPPMPPDGNIRRAHQRMAPGGRLWSESPVRGPAVRVVAAGDDPPGTPPSASEAWWTQGDLPAVGEGELAWTAGVALVHWTGWEDISFPAGWEVIASGGPIGDPNTFSGSGYWRVYVNPALTPSASTGPVTGSVDIDDPNEILVGGAYFRGVEGGTWAAEKGGYLHITEGRWVAPPAGAAMWGYGGAAKSVYTMNSIPDGIAMGSTVLGVYLQYPVVTGDEGATVAAWTSAEPLTFVDWNSIGAYGDYGSEAVTWGWTP